MIKNYPVFGGNYHNPRGQWEFTDPKMEVPYPSILSILSIFSSGDSLTERHFYGKKYLVYVPPINRSVPSLWQTKNRGISRYTRSRAPQNIKGKIASSKRAPNQLGNPNEIVGEA